MQQKFRILALGLALSGAALGSKVMSQTDDSNPPAAGLPWRMVLEQQLRAEKSCDLRELFYFNEFQLGDDNVIEGKVACIDGREFDFSRPREHQKFELKLCERTVC